MASASDFSHVLLSFLLGYFVGSFPTAFLLVKWKKGIDIRHAGSGNVGTLNAFETSGSKLVGIAVLLIDVLKGYAAVVLSTMVIGAGNWTGAVAGIGTIVGHNYSPWINFRGGRGLAPTAGVMLATGWIAVPLWCLLWVIVYIQSKQIHLANVFACIVAPLILVVIPAELVQPIAATAGNPAGVKLLFVALCLLILIRHLDQFSWIRKSFNNRPS